MNITLYTDCTKSFCSLHNEQNHLHSSTKVAKSTILEVNTIQMEESRHKLTSWRTMGCRERSLRSADKAGIASTSCIWPKANAASCANKCEESLVAARENHISVEQRTATSKESDIWFNKKSFTKKHTGMLANNTINSKYS